VHVAEPQRTVVDEPQTRVGEQDDEILRRDTAVAAMKVFRQPCSLRCSSRKIHG